MTDIFLSYKSEDRTQAKVIAEALEQHGYSVWWDRIIPPGKTFDQIIKNALDAAKCIIVLWSRESVSSDWVKEEASEGARRHILIPVLINDVEIPLGFKRIQAAQLINWQGTLPNPEFNLLIQSVEEIIGSKVSPELPYSKLAPLGEKKPINEMPKNISKSEKKWNWYIYGGIFYIILWILYIIFEVGLPDNPEGWIIFFFIVIIPPVVMFFVGYRKLLNNKQG